MVARKDYMPKHHIIMALFFSRKEAKALVLLRRKLFDLKFHEVRTV
jgi:hypothetical protein